MLLFFKKIRHDLLVEKRFSKYLLYVAGEIVVVVIGILIALQLNVYKENTENARAEITYLKGMLVDLDRDIYEINELIELDGEQIAGLTMIQRAFTDKDIKNSRNLLRAVGAAHLFSTFNGNSVVFEDMKSSGRITLISSDSLRLSILKYQKSSAQESKIQNEMSHPKHRVWSDEAFTNNLDLNSMIEASFFRGEMNAEIDPLDLSFFDNAIDSDRVRNFANRLSLMKSLVWFRNAGNKSQLLRAQELKSDILKYLANKGVEIKDEVPALVLTAIKQGDVDTLRKDVSGENIDTCFYMEDESGNYLVHSITYKSLAALKFFIEKGADIEGVCEEKTPLMYAVKYGELGMAKYLVTSGANLNANNLGKTPLYYARTYKHPKIESYLLSVGAE